MKRLIAVILFFLALTFPMIACGDENFGVEIKNGVPTMEGVVGTLTPAAGN